ncbi:MAG: hypothetical protein ABSE73_08520 [Planctomycetota bacterium]
MNGLLVLDIVTSLGKAGAGCANEEGMNVDCWGELQRQQRQVAGPISCLAMQSDIVGTKPVTGGE